MSECLKKSAETIKIRPSFTENKSALYLVSTPIGNLKDITYRAIETFNNVDLIYAEDTRVTNKLLSHYGINKSVYSYHSFNEKEKAKEIHEHLKNGLNVAFCTDAGTPAISDPGYYLVKYIKDDFPIISIPGASAILAGIISSGLVPQPFTFIGFTDRKSGKRKNDLKEYKKYPHTLVFYERAERIPSLVNDLYSVFGNRKCVLAKELTKMFETYIEFELKDNISSLDFKGEYVVMISGYVSKEVTEKDIKITLNSFFKDDFSLKDSVKLTSEKLNVNKNLVYEIAINIKSEEEK